MLRRALPLLAIGLLSLVLAACSTPPQLDTDETPRGDRRATTVTVPTWPRTLNVNQTQTQNSVSVTVENIEFMRSKTRVYVTVQNGMGNRLWLSRANMRLRQGREDYEADDWSLQGELAPGGGTSGRLTFPAVDMAWKTMSVVIEANAENYWFAFNPYVFQINW